jgi:MFS family permease
MAAPASLGIAIAALPVDRRATAVTIWSSTLALSSAVGPVIGGFVIELSSWRWAFALNIPIGLVALIWGARVLPETNRDPSARRPDIVGSVAITVTTSVLALLIVKGSEWGWSSPIILALIGSTIFGTGFLAQRIMRHPDPVLPKGLLAIRSFRVAIASLFLFGLGFFSSMLTVVLYFDDIANYSTVRAGFGISVLAVMAFTTANFSGRLADRFGYRRVLIPGMCLFILGCLWLYQNAGTDPNFVVDVFPALLLMGLGIGSGPTLLSAAAVSEVGQSDFSVAGAVAQTSRQLSGAIGISIAVVIIGEAADPNSFRSAFLFLAFVVMLAAFLASRLHSSN